MQRDALPLSDDMSDAALAALAANGSEQAFSELTQRMTPRLCALAVRYRGVSGLEADDLIQEGLLGLLAAVHSYREDVGDFSAFAVTCMRNRVISAVRRQLPLGEFETQTAEDVLQEIPDEGQADPERLLIRQEEAKRLMRRLREQLTPLEYTVLIAQTAGKRYREIAAMAGVSEKAVDNALQRARRKLASDGM